MSNVCHTCPAARRLSVSLPSPLQLHYINLRLQDRPHLPLALSSYMSLAVNYVRIHPNITLDTFTLGRHTCLITST